MNQKVLSLDFAAHQDSEFPYRVWQKDTYLIKKFAKILSWQQNIFKN